CLIGSWGGRSTGPAQHGGGFLPPRDVHMKLPEASGSCIPGMAHTPLSELKDQDASSGVLLASYLTCCRARSNRTGTGR
ncbi:unnamed protein product, partial [Urochloa humidicola]